ncbi:MAG: hypothetical protein ABEH66_05040 [Halobacteriales archaeon]
MEVRDAVEEDADALAELASGPRDVIRNLIHDRTVRIASEDGDTVAFVSFDARPGTVYVTQIGGEPGACKRLLEEPIRFAKGEEMEVELLVTEDETAIREAVADSGFEEAGPGPEFEGVPTVRYRLDPTGDRQGSNSDRHGSSSDRHGSSSDRHGPTGG